MPDETDRNPGPVETIVSWTGQASFSTLGFVERFGLELSAAVGEVVRDRRHEQGMTMEDLAAHAGLHRTSIGLVERGERKLTIATAAQIARSLGLATSELISLGEQRLAREDAREPDAAQS